MSIFKCPQVLVWHDTWHITLMGWCKKDSFANTLELRLFALTHQYVEQLVWRQWSHLTCITVTPCIRVNSMKHYIDLILGVIASQITSLTIAFSTIYSDADQRKHQSSASLAFVWGINREPLNSPHKWPVMRKMFPFDDVIMNMHTVVQYLVFLIW